MLYQHNDMKIAYLFFSCRKYHITQWVWYIILYEDPFYDNLSNMDLFLFIFLAAL